MGGELDAAAAMGRVGGRECSLHTIKIKVKGSGQECPPYTCKQQSRPTVPCDGPRMNPSVDVGNPPRPFRHLRMTERRTPDPSSSRVPVHSALVQKSVTAITNPAGRLSIWMLGKYHALGKGKTANSWQVVCYQSNNGAAPGRLPGSCGLKTSRPAGDGRARVPAPTPARAPVPTQARYTRNSY
jgi:hypothetical protein